MRAVFDEVVGLDMVGMFGPQPNTGTVIQPEPSTLEQPAQLVAKRDEDGHYVVKVLARADGPIDWFAVLWVSIGVVGLVTPIVSVMRWAIS